MRASKKASPKSPRGGGLAAGYARTEITPPLGSPLSGVISRKGRRAEQIHDPLHARALSLRFRGAEATVLTADLLAIPSRLHLAVAEQAGVRPESLLVSATHTHSGSGGYWDAGPRAALFTGPYREATFRDLAAALASTVRRARTKLAPAKLAGSRVSIAGGNANRRQLHGPIDPDLTLLRFETARGAPIDLVSFSGHPVIASEREPLSVSADFPGEVCARLERRGIRPLFFQGAVGATSPLFPEFPMKLDPHLALVGNILERGWEEAVRALEPVAIDAIETRIARVALPPPACRVFPDSLPFGRLAEAALSPLTRWVRGMAERGRTAEPDAPLHLVRIGRAALLGTPCDLGVSVALALKRVLAEAGIRFPIVGAQCDGYVGYVLMPEEYERVPEKGFRSLAYYENAMSLSGWQLGAEFVRKMEAELPRRVVSSRSRRAP